jgi:hypothetical protein
MASDSNMGKEYIYIPSHDHGESAELKHVAYDKKQSVEHLFAFCRASGEEYDEEGHDAKDGHC